MAERKPVQIAFIGEDRTLFRTLEGLSWEPTDNIFMVTVADAERMLAYFDIGQENLVLVDWQISVRDGVTPFRLLNLIKILVSQGRRVAVVIADDLYSTRLVSGFLEAGVCSLFFKDLSYLELNTWLERVLALPLRGPWVYKAVFP